MSSIVSSRPEISSAVAQDIMGRDFIGYEAGRKFLKARIRSEEIEVLERVPILAEELERYRQEYILVAPLLISIQEMKEQYPRLFYDLSWYCQPGCEEQFFLVPGSAIRWKLIRKHPVPRSQGKSWEAQRRLLEANEQVPTARETVYTMLRYLLQTGQMLFDFANGVRTADYVRGSGSVTTIFGRDGIHLGMVGDQDTTIGLASCIVL